MTNPDSQDIADSPDLTVVNDPAASRYQLRVDGEPAGHIEYVVRDGVTVMNHTEVDDAYSGQGVGSALVRQALNDVRDAGGSVEPVCPFVRSWIDEHPEYRDMVVA